MINKNKDAIKIAQYIQTWLNEYSLIIKASSHHTIRGYSQTLSIYLNFLELEKKINSSNFSFSCFSRDYIEQWIVWLKQKRGCSSETCNVRLSSLIAFLKYLGGKDVSKIYLFLEASQIGKLRTLRKKINGLSKNAIKALIEAPDPNTYVGRRDMTLFIIMYSTAVRIDEILSLKVKDVYLEVAKPYLIVIGKGSKVRTLFLLPRAVEHLKRYLWEFHSQHPQPEAYIFYSRNKSLFTKMSQVAVNKQLRKHAISAHSSCQEVPLNIHAHQIRHSMATHWLEDGVNIIQISFLLGHTNIETTMIYLDVNAEQIEKAIDTLDAPGETNKAKKWKSNINNLASFCGLK